MAGRIMKKQSKNEKSLPPTVINLDRDRLVMCDQRTSKTEELIFPEGTIRDLEIIDRTKLFTALQEFIKQKQIAPSPVILVLSPNIYFDKTLSKVSAEERDNEAAAFLESIPFASIGSRMFNIGSEFRIVAINRDLYEVVKNAFVGLGFKVVAAAPAFVLGPIGVPEQFSYESCRVIYRKLDYIIANSFLTDNTVPTEFRLKQRHYLSKHRIVFSIFSLLAIVLALGTSVMTLKRPVRQSASAKQAPASVVTKTPTKIPATPTPALVTDLALVKVSVLNGSSQAGQAEEISTLLDRLGFTDITTGNATAAADRTIVLVSSKVHPSVTEKVVTVLKSLFTEVNTQQVDQAENDITIISGSQE
jgi:hypothetical protein